MATIRVHEDQKSRIAADIRGRGKENIALAIPAQLHPQPLQQQTKRAVLGVLHNNCARNTKEISKDEKYPKTKAILPSQLEKFKITENKREESIFKIYEDKAEEMMLKIHENNEKNELFKVYEDKLEEETSVVLRNSKDKREFKTKHEVAVAITDLKKPILKIHDSVNLETFRDTSTVVNQNKQDANLFPVDSPMSLEKSLTYTNSSQEDFSARRTTVHKGLSYDHFVDVNEYRADIYNYLRIAETQHRPKPGYMKKQPDITYSMRSILVDWLVEVAEEYRLQSETLYLAVSYIDRFLSYMSVVRAKLQLVGTAAMFIAAKYEEIYPPDVGEFVYITDDTYTKKQVLRMENLILRVLSFDLTIPTPLSFLMEYCINNNLSEQIKFLAMYLCELSLLEADPYLQYLPSHLTAAAIALARHILQEEIWPHELELSTGYDLKSLKECISHLNRTFCNAPKIQQQAIQDKFKSDKYGRVSLLLPRNTDVIACEDEEESA